MITVIENLIQLFLTTKKNFKSYVEVLVWNFTFLIFCVKLPLLIIYNAIFYKIKFNLIKNCDKTL